MTALVIAHVPVLVPVLVPVPVPVFVLASLFVFDLPWREQRWLP